MTLAQLQALMTIRRAMGDAGQHVTLFSPHWDELAADMVFGGLPLDKKVMRDGSVRFITIQTCNGPTHVERIETTVKQEGVL